jgi:ClpP class serine protease
VQAKELRLVDELGGFAEAVAAARRLAEIPKDKERVLHVRVGDKLFGLKNLLGVSSLLEKILPATTSSESPFWWVMNI